MEDASELFILEIVTPESLFVTEQVVLAVLPAVDGDIGILAHHAPIVVSLAEGLVRLSGNAANDSGERCITINGGFAEVAGNRCVVLTENAAWQ